MQRYLPVSRPSISSLEEDLVQAAVRSTWVSSAGEFLERAEREFAAISGTSHALMVSNGTVALHVALLAGGLKAGDEVIVPSLTYVATANAVRYVGAVPVFVDVNPETWTMDPGEVAEVVTDRTKAAIPVHLYGHPADMDGIRDALPPEAFLLEDAAEAPFATYKGKPVGGLGDAATFSFYGNKILTSGEGGAVTTDDSDFAERLRLLRGQGMDPNRRYFFPVIGYNYRLTNVAAALLCGQLTRRDELLAARLRIVARYRANFAASAIGLQPCADWATVAPWLMCITLPNSCNRERICEQLAGQGIETRPFFIPVHTLPPYAASGTRKLPVTQLLSQTGLNLPTYPGLSDDEVDYISQRVLDLL